MTETKTGVLTVVGVHEAIVVAEKAYIDLSVTSSSLLRSDMGVQKIQEVAELIEEFKRQGIEGVEVNLVSMNASAGTGLLGKASSVSYRLKITCTASLALQTALTAISNLKSVRVNNVAWDYPVDDAVREEWLTRATTVAKGKAVAMARALGVRLTGIRMAAEGKRPHEERREPVEFFGQGDMVMARAELAPRVPLKNQRTILTSVEIDFYLSPMDEDVDSS